MELVEGEDLSQRIARGAIPIDEALPIAKQIAEALEAAHEQGIIHRDLKPANIKVRADGTVKVLDFGLAKAMEPAAGSSPSMSMSPTITTPAMTQAGMILGTAAYMSPEQARGKTVDKRADIWAFGCGALRDADGPARVRRRGHHRHAGERRASVRCSACACRRIRSSASVTSATCAWRWRARSRRPRRRRRRRPLRHADGWPGWPRSPSSPWWPSRSPFPRCGICARNAAAVAARDAHRDRHARHRPIPCRLRSRPTAGRSSSSASGDGASRLWLRSLASTTAQPLAGTEGAAIPSGRPTAARSASSPMAS